MLLVRCIRVKVLVVLVPLFTVVCRLAVLELQMVSDFAAALLRQRARDGSALVRRLVLDCLA